MYNKKTYSVGSYVVELIAPDRTIDLSHSLINNIDIYDKLGRRLWNISELLKDYSNEKGLKYYDELYFDIRPIDNNKIFCIGFINHCEIDLDNGRILKLVNNR